MRIVAKSVSLACTLDLAAVQIRDTFGVLFNRASSEGPLRPGRAHPGTGDSNDTKLELLPRFPASAMW